MPTDPNRSASPDATPRDAASVTPPDCNRCGLTDKMSLPRPFSDKQIRAILSDEADAEDWAHWRTARRFGCSRCEVTTTTFTEGES